MADTVIAEREVTDGRYAGRKYRVLQSMAASTPPKLCYWIQLLKDGCWIDVRGPYWQRPAALRKLNEQFAEYD